MSKYERTPIQINYDDERLLKKHGLPSKVDLASSTGGDRRDFDGLVEVRPSPELAQIARDAERRRLRMAGMDESPDGRPIGAALIVQDLKGLAKKIRGGR